MLNPWDTKCSHKATTSRGRIERIRTETNEQRGSVYLVEVSHFRMDTPHCPHADTLEVICARRRDPRNLRPAQST